MLGVPPGWIIGDDNARHTSVDERQPGFFRLGTRRELGYEDWLFVAPAHFAAAKFVPDSVIVLMLMLV